MVLLMATMGQAQTVKILFDATKAETAGNADWVIDENLNNMSWNPKATVGSGSEGNAQRIPTPAQSGITASTPETYWKGGISAWGIDCVKQGYTVETLPYNGVISYGNTSNPQDLSNYSVYIVCEPNILFTAAEKTAILSFVQNGGSLFMVSDHATSDRNNDGKDSPQILNDLMKNNTIQTNPFGLSFDSLSISPNTTNIPNLPADSLLNGPMGKVTQAMWASGTTMTLTPSANPTVKGVVYIPGSSFGNTGVMVAYARYGKGKVVAIGDSSPCDDGTGDSGDQLYDGWITDASGNHEKLIMNATIWLATKDSAVAPPPPPPLSIDSKMYALEKPDTLEKGANNIVVKIQNTGKAIIDTISLSYRVNTNSIVTTLLQGVNLKADSFYTHTFATPFTVSSDGRYTLCVWAKTKGDTLAFNDTLCKTLIVYTKPVIRDLKMDSFLAPGNLSGGQDTVRVTLRNTGNTRIDTAIVSYQWDGNKRVSRLLTNLHLDSSDTYTYSFDTAITLTVAGMHQVCAWVKTAGDTVVANDTLCRMVEVLHSGMEAITAAHALVSVFPNPSASPELVVESTTETIRDVSIRTIEGKELMRRNQLASNKVSIDVTDLPKGMYIVQVQLQHMLVIQKWIRTQ